MNIKTKQTQLREVLQLDIIKFCLNFAMLIFKYY